MISSQRKRGCELGLLAVSVALSAGCGDGRGRLLDQAPLVFVQDGVLLNGDSRSALAPQLPGEVTFDIIPPRAAFLRFSPALVMEHNVRRARVEFVIDVESSDSRRVEIYRELLRFQEANQWHDRFVSLGAWANEPIQLHLRTEIADGRSDALWAGRLRAVWAEPVVDTNVLRHLDARARAWLTRGGADPEELARVYRLLVGLLLGGPLALVVRALYLRRASSHGSREFPDLFPMFTLVTIVVIAVIESSLALSLGLIGAVSIVRFRTAVKTTEEISYLLFCVAVGLALGGGQPWLAMVTVVCVSSAVAVSWRAAPRPRYEKNVMLTVSGDADRFFGMESAVERIVAISQRFRFQRLDQRGERIEFRGVVTVEPDSAEALLSRLREDLPDFQFTFVDMEDVA